MRLWRTGCGWPKTQRGLVSALCTLLSSLCTPVILTVPLLAGCAATQSVSDPNTITLEHALVDTVDALNAAHAEALRNGRNFGFYGCSVTAVYNISATGTQDNKITVTGSGPPAAVVPIAIGGTFSSESTASGTRGNTVTVVFDTKYCVPSKTSGTGTNAKGPPPVFLPRRVVDHKE
jgi:hypothetical protein